MGIIYAENSKTNTILAYFNISGNQSSFWLYKPNYFKENNNLLFTLHRALSEIKFIYGQSSQRY